MIEQAMPVEAIAVTGLVKRFGSQTVLDAIDLHVPQGQVIGLLGLNGSGKSTLIKCLLGLLRTDAGSALVLGTPAWDLADREKSRIGYVPQRETVDWDFPVSVSDVVLMGTYGRLGWFRRPGRRERDLAGESLARVGLADVAGRQIGKLSGGQQQRVFLARALAQQADVYVLDEPMAGVDARSQELIFGVLSELRDAGRLVVVVHHDLRTAAQWFDRVALIDMRLVAAGPTATVLTPENLERTYAGRLDVLDELGRAVAGRGRTT